jgi:hypothetical protein
MEEKLRDEWQLSSNIIELTDILRETIDKSLFKLDSIKFEFSSYAFMMNSNNLNIELFTNINNVLIDELNE